MRVLIINSVSGVFSTGKICAALADRYIDEGHEVRIAYGRETVPEEYQDISVSVCSKTDIYINVLKSRFFDNEGFNAKKSTKRFLKWADEYDPDLVWLHNLHGYYMNVEMLFAWIKKRPQMQVKWTLHDCWAFTGHCAHFSYVKCMQWKNECKKCIQSATYPASFTDNCQNGFLRKRAAFTGVSNMTLVVPSYWLAELVKQSFLQEYPVEVIYNTVNVDIFKPSTSDFKKRYDLEDKKIILGVASVWTERKGLFDFYKLSEMIDDQYVIVLVGLTDKQSKNLPANVIGIERTKNQKELAEIYTAADIFVNPSKEETFGLTILEALLCGTPAIVYKNTACEEVVNFYGNGMAVDESISLVFDAIKKLVKM